MDAAVDPGARLMRAYARGDLVAFDASHAAYLGTLRRLAPLQDAWDDLERPPERVP